LSILFVAVAGVSAAPGVSKGKVGALRAVAGSYSCGFDSPTGYVAPGTSESVHVGGVFTLTIDNHGAITQSDATLSVDDGGAGPAVCSYASGAGSVGTAPFTGNFGDATLTYQADNANSSLCPSGNASMTFGPVDNGLKFIYSNTSGFTGQGTCGVSAAPPGPMFTCSYNVSGEAGGTGLAFVNFSPRLNQKPNPFPPNTRWTFIGGIEVYPTQICPFFGFLGVSIYPSGGANKGKWGAVAAEPLDCPTTPFGQVNFATTDTTILITAPGISSAVCESTKTVGNDAAKIDATPNLLKFGGQTGKTTSPAQPVTVTNTGTQTVNLIGFAVIGNDFDQSNDCEDTLDSGAHCTVNVTFTPKAKGTRNGTLEILSDAIVPKVNVKLSGLGQ
jgi:hypothetical protein